MTAADWVIVAVLAVSGCLSVFRGFIKEAVSLAAWVAAFVVTGRFYTVLADRLTFMSDGIARYTLSCVILFVGTLILVGFIGRLISMAVSGAGLSGMDRLLGMVFGVLRGVLLVSVVLALLQIGLKLNILSFVEDTPFYRDSLLIPEFRRIVDWFFSNKELQESINLNVGA